MLNSLKENKINNILPFSDLFYKDCFYNSLFPIIIYLNENIINFFINDIIIYKHSVDNILQVDVEYITLKPFKKILADMNILYHKIYESNDILKDIKKSIDIDNPVIIKVDCYFESIRKDLYKKEHLDHNLLVFGYNDFKEVFDIYEHKNINSFKYKHEHISYFDIQTANNGFATYFSHLSEPLYIKFFKLNNTKKEHTFKNLLDVFSSNYLNYFNDIACGLENIHTLKKNLLRIFNEKELFDQNADKIIELITSIINSKNIEYYRTNYFIKNKEINNLIKKIIQDWTYIRLTIFSYKFSGDNIEDKLIQSINILNKLCITEKKFIEYVFNYLKQK